MSSNTSKPNAETQAWVKETLNKGVYALVDLGIFDEVLVEAKPAWVLPHALLIGKMRNKGSEASTRWFICGNDCPTLHTPEEMATTPRAAARHFALMWQSALGENVVEEDPQNVASVQKAESLYALSEADELWLS